MANKNKNVTLSVDSETYNKYSEYCKKNGLVISKRFEIFMQNELKGKEGTNGKEVVK